MVVRSTKKKPVRRGSSRALQVLRKLYGQHPGADTELDYKDPYQLLVATILSAQSTDAGVNRVTPALFKRYPNAAALAKATAEELEPLIHSTGFYRSKAKSLMGMARALVEHHAGQVPDTMEALVELPGVGRKTANVVLGHALGVPGLPVDRHVLARLEPHRHRFIGGSRRGRAAARKRAASRRVDESLRYADPAWAAHLQTEAALRPVRGPRRLRFLSHARERVQGRKARR